MQWWLVRLLLCADDLALLADTPEQLQELLNALHSFCAANDMHVNVQKTEIVVFGRKRYPAAAVAAAQWHYSGQVVPVSTEFKYLGIVFRATAPVAAATDVLATAGRKAM